MQPRSTSKKKRKNAHSSVVRNIRNVFVVDEKPVVNVYFASTVQNNYDGAQIRDAISTSNVQEIQFRKDEMHDMFHN